MRPILSRGRPRRSIHPSGLANFSLAFSALSHPCCINQLFTWTFLVCLGPMPWSDIINGRHVVAGLGHQLPNDLVESNIVIAHGTTEFLGLGVIFRLAALELPQIVAHSVRADEHHHEKIPGVLFHQRQGHAGALFQHVPEFFDQRQRGHGNVAINLVDKGRLVHKAVKIDLVVGDIFGEFRRIGKYGALRGVNSPVTITPFTGRGG